MAGVYGLIVIFTGGSLAQLSLYLYSVLALAAFFWGLKAVSEVCFNLHSFPLFSSHRVSIFISGGSQTNAIFRTRLLCRPHPQHHLDDLLQRPLVGVQPTRRAPYRQLRSAGENDGVRRESHHDRRGTKRSCAAYLESGKRPGCSSFNSRVAYQGLFPFLPLALEIT